MGRVKSWMEDLIQMVPCSECDGDGCCEYERAVPMSNSNPYGYLEGYWAECENCNGSGEIEREDEDE